MQNYVTERGPVYQHQYTLI